MKKNLQKFGKALAMALTLVLFACGGDDKLDEGYAQQDLVGTWQSGTLYEKYAADGNGSTWDTKDDVTEAEAQRFTWTLNEDNLVQLHILEVGGEIPKSYTITELTSTTLVYVDDYDNPTTFVRIK